MRAIARGGDAVVETTGGLVFVPGALPGERVRLTQVRRAGPVLRGRLSAVLEPSPDRVEPPCPIQARCGGCPLMPLARARQRAILGGFVAEAVGQDPIFEATGEGDGGLRHRRRARLAFSRGDHQPRLGYRRRRSHHIVDVPSCPVLAPALDRAVSALRASLLPCLEGGGELHLALGAGGVPVVALRSEGPQPPSAYRAVEALVAGGQLAGAALRVGGATVDATVGDPREVSEGADGAPLIGPPAGFSQAQEGANRALVDRVVALAAPEGARLLELYAGHGNLTVALGRRAAHVTAVEQSPASVAALRDNLRARALEARVTVLEGDAATAAAGAGPFDVVVLDPPRTGAREALDAIAACRPARIVYVSCDPATLGRDLAALGRLGYVPARAHAFDMFPHTAHVESVTLLVRG